MKLLTLDQTRLEEIVLKAHQFTVDPTVEQDIEELLEAYQAIESAIKMVRASFKDKFVAGEMENSVEGDKIRVVVSNSGSIYKLVDETIVDPHLLKLALDTEAVQSWVDENEKLPEGVEYNKSRGFAVRIGIKGGAHE